MQCMKGWPGFNITKDSNDLHATAESWTSLKYVQSLYQGQRRSHILKLKSGPVKNKEFYFLLLFFYLTHKMKEEMKKFAQKEDHNKASCAVVAFLSHGDNGKIKGKFVIPEIPSLKWNLYASWNPLAVIVLYHASRKFYCSELSVVIRQRLAMHGVRDFVHESHLSFSVFG